MAVYGKKAWEELEGRSYRNDHCMQVGKEGDL